MIDRPGHPERPPAFFAQHAAAELLTWAEHDLEQVGRLAQPMRFNQASDRYVEVGWAEACAEIGRELKAQLPASVVLYTWGRASLEAA